jgi:hypothetical protein
MNQSPARGAAITLPAIFAAVLILAFIFSYWIFADRPTPIEKEVVPEGWMTYRNEQLGFKITLPEGWLVADHLDDEIQPILNFYPPNQPSEPPYIHHSNATHVSVFPRGVPTEGVFGQTEAADLNLQVPTREARNFILNDGRPWATMVSLQAEERAGWDGFAFLWSTAPVDNMRVTCLRDGNVISNNQCDPMTMNDEVIHHGSLNEEVRATQEQILESFQFID